MSMEAYVSKAPRKVKGAMDLSKALKTMGFNGWSELVPDIEIMEEEEVKKILDEILFKKTKDIEIRRALKMKKHKEALEMADGALKRRIEYEMKNDKLLSSHDEERSLHEAYQFLMREYEARYKMAMIAAAAAATERAFGSDLYQDRVIVSTTGNDSDGLYSPGDEIGSKKNKSSQKSNRKGRSSRDKSPRPSPMPERPERKPKRQPKGLSATYHGTETKSIYRGEDECFNFDKPLEPTEEDEDRLKDELQALFTHLDDK